MEPSSLCISAIIVIEVPSRYSAHKPQSVAHIREVLSESPDAESIHCKVFS